MRAVLQRGRDAYVNSAGTCRVDKWWT